MQFKVGDPVVHWTYGLGKVVAVEERALGGQKALYYVVEISDMTVWVPVDEKAKTRLRPPTSQKTFKKALKILREPGKSLSEDRHERKLQLHKKLQDGKVESICTVIRDLSYFQHKKPLNDDDKVILKRASTALLGEWGYSFSVPIAEAEQALQGLLQQPAKASRS
ncbi:MAG: CarD family transcriptional regulator [Anaerolineae bacterium]